MKLETENSDGTHTIAEIDLETLRISDVTERPKPVEVPARSPLEIKTSRYRPERVVGRGGFADVLEASSGREFIMKGASFSSWMQHAEVALDKFAQPHEGHTHYGARLAVTLR